MEGDGNGDERPARADFRAVCEQAGTVPFIYMSAGHRLTGAGG